MRRFALFLVASTSLYTTGLGQERPHPVLALALDADLGWIEDGTRFDDGPVPKRGLSPAERAVDRGALLDGAIARAAEQDRLVLWYVPRFSERGLGGVQMYRAPVLDVYMRQVVFCDPDVAALVDSAFVPVRLVCDEALSQRFGLRPLVNLEPALVFLDGAGELVHVVDHIRTFNAHWFATLFARVLAAAEVPVPAGLDWRGLAARGLWTEALEELAGQGERELEELVWSAGLLRRLRRTDEAARLLSVAESSLEVREGSAAQSSELFGALQLERGLLRLQLGELAAAREPLEAAWERGSAEAGYLSAWALFRSGDEAGATRRFQEVADQSPDSSAGRRARANVTLGPDERPLGATFSGFESIGIFPEAAYQGLPEDTSWPGDPLPARSLAARAVRFLLEQQRDDGGFCDARYAYWPDARITPNTWVAISALALTALVEYRDLLGDQVDPRAIDRALERGEAYLFDPAHLNRGANEEVYADAFRLLYLVSRVRHSPGEDEALRTRMAELVTAAAGHQRSSGFFSHEYSNAFCTAAMLWALLDAREVGAEVPDEVLERGAGALAAARQADGAFAYGGTAAGGGSSLKDAAGRMPLCEAVLLALDRGGRADLAFAHANFWEHFERLRGVRLNDFHSDGELAGFFFFHDLFLTSETLDLLPPKMAADYSARLLQVLQEIAELDGSYLDSHEFGRSYGTAMALLTLRNVAAW